MTVRFRDLARSDLQGITDFIAADNPKRAESFVNEVIDRCLLIGIDHTRRALALKLQRN